jgi:3-methyl-2-oxobutanoate hydroxymethyltransferase
MTVPRFARQKSEGRKITMLTAYDYGMAAIVDACGVDSILVGDSLSMVVQGRENTIPVTIEQMIYHAEMVCRAVHRALVIVDIPFPGYHAGRTSTVKNAARILKETGAQAVKLEGGAEQASAIEALVRAGIPVMAHIGLRPQNILQLGSYRVERNGVALLEDAKAIEQAGAFSLLLECIPRDVARQITEQVKVPTIGIGAGPDCDGQVLVLHDILGLVEGKPPKHARQYVDLRSQIIKVCKSFCDDVRSGEFPDEEHSFE